jgi:DNA polymerase-3 subunit gamma/tau
LKLHRHRKALLERKIICSYIKTKITKRLQVMSYLVTARKWRPTKFAEVVGQEHVTATLLNSLKLGRIAHAYIFAGPRGVGKTTVARILAKAINCLNPQNYEPCNECEMCLK